MAGQANSFVEQRYKLKEQQLFNDFERQVEERVSAVLEQRSQKNPPLSQNRNQNMQMNSQHEFSQWELSQQENSQQMLAQMSSLKMQLRPTQSPAEVLANLIGNESSDMEQ